MHLEPLSCLFLRHEDSVNDEKWKVNNNFFLARHQALPFPSYYPPFSCISYEIKFRQAERCSQTALYRFYELSNFEKMVLCYEAEGDVNCKRVRDKRY